MPTPTAHNPDHEALIASFITEGWSRKDAEFRAYRFRSAFDPRTPYSELLRRREMILADVLASRVEAGTPQVRRVA